MEKGKDQRGTPERGEYTENILIETGEQWAIAIEKKKETYQYVWLVFCEERPSFDVLADFLSNLVPGSVGGVFLGD